MPTVLHILVTDPFFVVAESLALIHEQSIIPHSSPELPGTFLAVEQRV